MIFWRGGAAMFAPCTVHRACKQLASGATRASTPVKNTHAFGFVMLRSSVGYVFFLQLWKDENTHFCNHQNLGPSLRWDRFE